MFSFELPGCTDMWEWAATGAIFSRIEEKGATATGRTLATVDEEPGKNGPVPKGCNQIRPDGFSPGNAARSYMSIHPGPCFEGARLRSLRRKNQKPHGRTPKPATARFTPEQEASSPATRPSIGFGFRFTRKYYTFPFWARLDCVRANSIALEEQRL
jgi:hypothetical protein